MLLTLWCVAIVIISIVAVGIPLRWLLHGCHPLDEQAWIETPFLGIAAIILVLQNLVYLNVPIQYSAPVLWVIALAGWLWIARSGQLRVILVSLPGGVFITALVVYLIQGLGLVYMGASRYVGRAWNDQINYTAIAQFLANEPFSTSFQEAANRPYMLNAIRLKTDRIGQSVLHGFFTVSSFQDAKTLFEPTILLTPALITLALYALGRRAGLSKPYALLAAAVAGLMPAVASIHLESFLSQALAVPLLLFLPILLDQIIQRPSSWQPLLIGGLIVAALTSIYSEFWIIIVALIFLTIGLSLVGARQLWQRVVCLVALIVAPFVLNPFYIQAVLNTLAGVDRAVLGELYPWAFTIQGMGRLWLGDIAAPLQPGAEKMVRAYAIVMSALGLYGLLRLCLGWLFGVRFAWRDARHWHSFIFALAVLALLLLPVAILIRDTDHAYQFYKILLSVSPLLVLGLALAFKPVDSGTSDQVEALPQGFSLAAVATLLGLGIALLGSLAGTGTMAWHSTSALPAPRYNGYYLSAPDTMQLQAKLESMHDQNLFFYQTDATGGTGFLNAWFAYFARHNQIWLGNPMLNDSDASSRADTQASIDLDTLPDTSIVLSDLRLPNAASLPQRTVLWQNASYQLWQPATPYWVLPLRIDNPNGLEQLDGVPFFWAGQGNTVIEVLASKPGTLALNATFLMGPSAPGKPDRMVFITTDDGYAQQLSITSSDQQIRVPVRANRNKITLRVLDLPTVTQQSNNKDARPLLLGIKELKFVLTSK